MATARPENLTGDIHPLLAHPSYDARKLFRRTRSGPPHRGKFPSSRSRLLCEVQGLVAESARLPTTKRSPQPGAQFLNAPLGRLRTIFWFDSAPLILWWDTGRHAAREEAQVVELSATSLVMRVAGFLIAQLGALKTGGDAREVMAAVVSIKPSRAHQCVGGVADLAQRDQRISPPADVRFGVPRTSG